MSKIIFISNSNIIHFYYWKCIERINHEFDNCSIFIYIERSNLSQPTKTLFNPIINYIDSKFSNFSTNPFELVDLNLKAKKLKNVCIINSLDDLKKSDWIIFESKKLKNKFNNFTEKGILLLDLDYNLIRHNTINSKLMTLSIAKLNQKSEKWEEIFNINLKCETGIKNNIHKIAHNYSIFLVKFLKNSNKLYKANGDTTSCLKKTFKPSAFIKIKFLYYYLRLILKIFIRKLKKNQFNWKIGIKKDGTIKLLKQPKNSFWADPFLIKSENQNYFIYFEELKQDNLGKISCIETNSEFEILQKEDVINTNYHLSFPNVFFKDGNYYMIPESSQINTLQLYECSKLPFQWTFKMNLMENIKLVDAIWVQHNGLYWIFANKIEDFEHDNNEKLYLYYSNDLFSNNWKPHVKNPIVTDASTARNAGNFILDKGKLIRPSQNCLEGYGRNIVMNKVKILNTQDYIEEKIDEKHPIKGYVGSHTFNKNGNVSVLDYLIKE